MFEIVDGPGLAEAPSLLLGNMSVACGSASDPEEHEKHFLATVGSGNWYFSDDDEFRFDPVTGVLRSFRLHVPERNATSYVLPDLPVESGSIRLVELRAFGLESSVLRWFSTDGQQVAGLYTVDEPDRRVRVAPDFDLLFAGGELVGWVLVRTGFSALLGDYFSLVTEATIDRLEQEDPSAVAAVEALAARAGRHPDLQDRLRGMVDFFTG
ncbi:hypothetical protein GCM10029964_124810 [Kibdelosporangium lantanae]